MRPCVTSQLPSLIHIMGLLLHQQRAQRLLRLMRQRMTSTWKRTSPCKSQLQRLKQGKEFFQVTSKKSISVISQAKWSRDQRRIAYRYVILLTRRSLDTVKWITKYQPVFLGIAKNNVKTSGKRFQKKLPLKISTFSQIKLRAQKSFSHQKRNLRQQKSQSISYRKIQAYLY